MLTTPIVMPVTIPERFDGNQVEFTGLVTKIWARSTGDVFTRVAIGEDVADGDDSAESSPVDARLTLRLPNGQVNGQDISLLKGDVLRVTGYLSDITQWETLRDFLLKARQPNLGERIPELMPVMDVSIKRMVTCVIPETLDVLTPQKAVKNTNQTSESIARLEGVVARVWEYGGHLFARVASYDRHTLTTTSSGNNGRERRIPHYVTVQFLNEQVDGRGVNLKPKDRIRISGILGSRVYSENLRNFLLNAHKADVLATLTDGQAADDVWTAYVQTCLVAQKMIQYTKR
jgi:hypothetical protein